MAAPELRKLRLWQNRIETEVEVSGHGPPLVYLHGPWGLNPDRAFIAQLAAGHTVYAPKFPGTSRGDHAAIHALDTWLDLVVYHGELFDRLELTAPVTCGPFVRCSRRRRIRSGGANVGWQARADQPCRAVAG